MISGLILAVAIIAHDAGFSTSLAKHLQRWLRSENVIAQVATPAQMQKVLANERLAFLVGFANPSAAEIATLKGFRSRGGKLVVFHSSSPALAAMMGVKPIGFKKAAYSGQWSRMVFPANGMIGAPACIQQSSGVLQCAAPIQGRSRVIASWCDRAGRSTGDAAWLASGAGYWMTHVLLADGDEDLKAQLLGAIVGSVEPGKWSLKSHLARVSAQKASIRAYAAQQVPIAGEIHAVWDHSGCGLYPGNWPKTIQVLKAAKVTDLFVNVAGAGFAHYTSSVLPHSKIYDLEGDQLAKATAAAKGSGIRIHAWILCFTASRATPERQEIFRKNGWRLKDAKGRLTEYLDPANPSVRAHLLRAIDEIQARYPIAGIHLDFVRWGESSVKPRDAALHISKFVAAVRSHVKRPKWLTTAVYGKYPNCIGSVGQDWCGWIDSGIVDYAVPMDYTESNAIFESYLAQHAASRNRAHRIIAGIGVTANESRLNAKNVIDQIRLSRKYGIAGVSLFDLDVTLEKQILPYLKLGIW